MISAAVLPAKPQACEPHCQSFQPVAFTPHVTLIHPRTSDRGGDFWACAEPPRSGADFAVSAVAITAFDGARCHVTETFRLSR